MSGFGDFTWICERTPFPVCGAVGPVSPISGMTGIDSHCYARNVDVANTIIFQMATSFLHIIALTMTIIMILHVRSKFTAVGRKELCLFFYIYMALTIVSLILDAGVVPPISTAFPYFVAIQNGLASALCTCLLINGFVGFQLYEDGTTQSMWMIRGCSAAMFLVSGAVSILTFEGKAGLSPTNTTGLFVVVYLFNAVFLLIYVIMQFILVLNTLQDRWPLGNLFFGTFFFIAGQILVYVFGERICEGVNHYLDGLVFATACNLLAVMMVYKYWDSITKEDLEFSVGTKQGNWEVKELMSDTTDRTTAYLDDPSVFSASTHHRQSTMGDRRHTAYGGGY